MKYIAPNAVNDETLLYSSAPEADALPWSSGVTYGATTPATRVMYAHRVYEALATTTGDVPALSPEKWLLIGPTNRWAMFDASSSTVTSVNDNALEVRVRAGAATTLILQNIRGQRVEAHQTDGAEVLYNRTFILSGTPDASGWFEYWYGDTSTQQTSLTINDLVKRAGSIVTVRVVGFGTVEVGTLVIGESYELGGVEMGLSIGYLDLSKKETDEFGNTTIVERGYVAEMSGYLIVDASDADRVTFLLRDLRAKPGIWIATANYQSAVIYGFLREPRTEHRTGRKLWISFRIEGMGET